MKEEMRKTGIDIMGDVPWGIHLCQFYQTKKDLIDILVPYFKAGLENNEFCMWVTSGLLRVEDAKTSLKKVVKDLDDYIKKGQIEILDYSQWYTKSGKFDGDKVLEGLVKKENQAIKRGFDGLRLTGNTFWLEERDWKSFADYEEKVNDAIGKYRIIAICTYHFDKCGASEAIDVVSNHQFALIKRESKWEMIENAERKRAEKQLRDLAAHLESTREDERTQIARQIHDELGQTLTALKMDLHWLGDRLPKDQKLLAEKTNSMTKLIDTTIQTVRRISTELRPGILDDLGLAAAMDWQAEEFQNRTGIKCKVTFVPEHIILDKDRSTVIFRILQETLTNVARHANATGIKVGLEEKAGNLVLKVRDDGKGITEEQISHPKSFGLIGIRERANFFGGEVKISGIKDKGTTVSVSIPVERKDE